MTKLFKLLGVLAFALQANAHANLVDLGNGSVYDTTRDITWTQDVRYDEIDLNPTGRFSAIQGTLVSNVDGSTHLVSPTDLYQASNNGTFRVGGTWWGATAWAQTLTFAGTSGWRLPSSVELTSLIADGSYNPTFLHTANGSYPYLMWTSSESGANSVLQVETNPIGNPASYVFSVPKSLDESGSFIQVAWAVHDGNIAAPIPEPSTWILFLLGLTLLSARAARTPNCEFRHTEK